MIFIGFLIFLSFLIIIQAVNAGPSFESFNSDCACISACDQVDNVYSCPAKTAVETQFNSKSLNLFLDSGSQEDNNTKADTNIDGNFCTSNALLLTFFLVLVFAVLCLVISINLWGVVYGKR